MKPEGPLRACIRAKHDSARIEEAYAMWYRQYVRYFGMRHPAEMGAAQVEAFDSHASSGASRPAGFAALSLSRG